MLHLMFVHLMGLLSPGPDFFYVSRTAAIHSRRTAIYGVIGITIGVTIWATATASKNEIIKGLLVNLSNAKVVIYFSSVMSFVLVNITETRQILTALLIITIETFVYFYVISLLFSRPFAKRFYSRYSRYIDNASGVIFILFGAYLIYSGALNIMS